MTHSDWAMFGATLFLGIAAVIVALFGPFLAEMGRKLFLAPRLKIEFDENQHSFCHITKKWYDRGKDLPVAEFPVYYFRFSVSNEGKSLAHACEVVLEEILKCDENGIYKQIEGFWPTNLKWEGGSPKEQPKTQLDINPKRPKLFVDIGHICHPDAQKWFEPSSSLRTSRTDPGLRFIFEFPFYHFAKIDSLSSGKYLLKVVILGENCEPVRKQFELCWSGNWTEDENQMLKKEAVIKMAEEKDQIKSEEAPSQSYGLMTQIKPFTLGILFFLFSLSLFGSASPNWGTKTMAIIASALSILFLAVILLSLLPFIRRLRSSKFLASSLARNSIQIGWLALWEITFATYLLSYLLSWGNSLTRIGSHRLGHFLDVMGVIWFFVIFAVLLSPAMPQGELKSQGRKFAFGVVLTATSLGPIIGGAIWAYNASNFTNLLSGIFLALSGVLVLFTALLRDKLRGLSPV